MNNAFNRLDDGKATLRILIELYSGLELASRGQLEESLEGVVWVGRRSIAA